MRFVYQRAFSPDICSPSRGNDLLSNWRMKLHGKTLGVRWARPVHCLFLSRSWFSKEMHLYIYISYCFPFLISMAILKCYNNRMGDCMREVRGGGQRFCTNRLKSGGYSLYLLQSSKYNYSYLRFHISTDEKHSAWKPSQKFSFPVLQLNALWNFWSHFWRVLYLVVFKRNIQG